MAGGKLTNPFKKKLNEAVEVEEEKLIDTESTIADVKKDIEQRTKEFSEEAARESQKLFGEITDSVQPSLTTGLTKEALDIGTRFLTRLGVPTNPDLKVSDQIFDALSLIKTDEKSWFRVCIFTKRNKQNSRRFCKYVALRCSRRQEK